MASIMMRSAVAKVLIAAVAVSTVGVVLAAEAPAPAPTGVSSASGSLPGTVATTLMVAITGSGIWSLSMKNLDPYSRFSRHEPNYKGIHCLESKMREDIWNFGTLARWQGCDFCTER
ncbi:hypothetical protein AXG93_2116s1110 [Marchantia polymorpha subsp. ruderalis]|uniref:Uncharacterized protein n=1 Tax=Marchantia polymorpha subsp. ruderalis TaxID=1480154 RepID=A0A176VLQ3_MARPO|nr:hypothetical protein AXG93_2116s1110 [Marchantia polymorpha subsp. ruderalis]